MDLSGILSIVGKPGLYKHISQTKNGIIVESLTDKKRMHAFASDKISSLQDIAIYTEGEDVALTEIFKNIFKKEDGKKSIDSKSSSDVLKKYFEEVLPDYDKDRVYVSNIKRVISWYNILLENKLVNLEEDKKEDDEKKETVETKETVEKTDKTEKKKVTERKEEK